MSSNLVLLAFLKVIKHKYFGLYITILDLSFC